MDKQLVLKKAIDFAKPYYQTPHRIKGYHNWNHIQECMSLFQKHFKGDISEHAEFILYMALIFHDVVYIGSSEDNEENSEKIFKIFCAHYSDFLSNEDKDNISELIFSTKHKRPARVKNEEILTASKILHDIDHAYIGYKFVEFMKKRVYIRHDFIMYSQSEFYQGSTLFCNSILMEQDLYLTQKFKNLFEEQAFHNLNLYLKLIKKTPVKYN